MILLARLIIEEQKENSKGHALKEARKEFLSRVGDTFKREMDAVSRPAENQDSIEAFQHERDHAWELVFHWVHTLAANNKIHPEEALYVPAFRKMFSEGSVEGGGNIHDVWPKIMTNLELIKILMPDLYQVIESHKQAKEAAQKKTTGRLVAAEKERMVMGELKKIMQYTVERVEHAGEGLLIDVANQPQLSDGKADLEQKTMLAFLAMMATLLTPYVAPVIITSAIMELKNGKPLMSSLHGGLVGNRFLPKLPDHLSEEEQQKILSDRLLMLRVFAVASPVLGSALFYLGHH